MHAPTTARAHSPLPISPQVLVRGLASAPLPSLLNLQIELRKCCNHPFLIRGVEQSVTMGTDEAAAACMCSPRRPPFPTGDDGHG